MTPKTVLLGTALLFAAATLAAEGSGDGPGRDSPCKADVQRLCASVKPGGGRILACLKDHRAEVSGACQAALQTMRERRAAVGGDDPAKADADAQR